MLENTLLITTNDPAAKESFRKLIFDNNFIVFVGIGNDPRTDAFIKRADSLAFDQPQRVVRRVIWLHDHTFLAQECMDLLKTHPEFITPNHLHVNAFTISPRWHEVKAIIKKTDPINEAVLRLAYLAASRRERNTL